MKINMLHFAGKKLLLVVPAVLLLAAGCSSSSSSSNQTTNQSNLLVTPTPAAKTSPTPSSMSNSSMWQGTLQKSDNSAKGTYELMTGGHTIYIHTSRDYSALVGKQVNVSYSGSLLNFSLGDIVAQ